MISKGWGSIQELDSIQADTVGKNEIKMNESQQKLSTIEQ